MCISGPVSFLGDGYLWYQVSTGGGYVQGLVPTPVDVAPGIPRDMVSEWAKHILLECFRVCTSMAHQIVIGM